MTREEAKKLAPVVAAYAEGKEVEWLHPDGWRKDPNFNPVWHSGIDYRIAKERQSLGTIYEGNSSTATPLTPRECYIEGDGLHVGCTTISFERVKEIAAACRKWQGDGATERLLRFFILPKTESNSDCTYGYKTLREAEQQGVPSNWSIRAMREVLPGEDDL
jgi:hypothetical protein